jgi:flagellar biosynthesis protein
MRRYNISTVRKTAEAISYHPEEGAPRILAVGQDREAERILAIAREQGITIVEDPVLAALLEQTKPGDFVPAWCWEAVAKILAFVLSKEVL